MRSEASCILDLGGRVGPRVGLAIAVGFSVLRSLFIILISCLLCFREHQLLWLFDFACSQNHLTQKIHSRAIDLLSVLISSV